MQYWMLKWDNPCPSGWISDEEGDCFSNSMAVAVPKEGIRALDRLKLSGSAQSGGLDTLVFSVGKEAYSATGSDSVLDLATAWNKSEFNIFGDGDLSEADFNSGSSIAVLVEVFNGTTNAPRCLSGAGTTGETNNLNLGLCDVAGGATPYIEFTESN